MSYASHAGLRQIVRIPIGGLNERAPPRCNQSADPAQFLCSLEATLCGELELPWCHAKLFAQPTG